ncbi:apoptosis facilitator Bcl-2-like protein 14 [Engystomops pustulosus]|uniref:apoptosis facilitator Bcl-2-like protein 14 n=1 Tax=Engystomops pustulosus TaxID=76066 RepID=UPI003AFA1B00
MVSVRDEALEEVPLQEEEEGLEFRVLMVYAQRTLPRSRYEELMKGRSGAVGDVAASNGGHLEDLGPSVRPKKEKKKSFRRMMTPMCLRPAGSKKQKKVKSPSGEKSGDARVRGLVQRLAAIVQRLQEQDHQQVGFRGVRRLYSIEHDGDGEENLIAEIVAILRAEGDKLDKEMTQGQSSLQRFRSCLSYDFFRRLAESYVEGMVPTTGSEEERQSCKIALCFHATTRLAALDNHPMNRMFGFGARYLKEDYSEWIREHGGWEKVMGITDAQEEEESVED